MLKGLREVSRSDRFTPSDIPKHQLWCQCGQCRQGIGIQYVCVKAIFRYISKCQCLNVFKDSWLTWGKKVCPALGEYASVSSRQWQKRHCPVASITSSEVSCGSVCSFVPGSNLFMCVIFRGWSSRAQRCVILQGGDPLEGSVTLQRHCHKHSIHFN